MAVFCVQHSMRLGHLALSQTVSSRNSSISRAVKWLPLPSGIFFLSQRGSRSSGKRSARRGDMGVAGNSDTIGRLAKGSA